MAIRSRTMLAAMLALSGAAAGAMWWGATTDRSTGNGPVLTASAAEVEDDPSNPIEPATETQPAAAAPAPVSPAPASPAPAATAPTAPAPAMAASPSAEPLDAQAAMLPAPLGNVTLARQTLRRGGLGSQVRGSFTVRNRNDFAIKDVEILCAFQGQSGYVTQRRQVIHDTIDGQRRETFANVLVGHISVAAPRGKCRLLGASRA